MADNFVCTPDSDVLVLPGGALGAGNLATDARVRRLVRAYRASPDKLVAAISAGTMVLVAAAAADKDAAEGTEEAAGRKKVRVTSDPIVQYQIVNAGWEYASEERVIIDGRVVTSRSPGTALEWALAIVEASAGQVKRAEVQGPMQVQFCSI
jgi:protein DJ-1